MYKNRSLFFVFGLIFLMFACNKSDDIISDSASTNNHNTTMLIPPVDDFENYIDSLSYITGIDIEAVAAKDVYYSDFNNISLQYELATSDSCVDQNFSSKIDTIMYYADYMQFYLELDNTTMALLYYDSLSYYVSHCCNYIYTDELQNTEINREFYQFPLNQMNAIRAAVNSYRTTFIRGIPEFAALSETLQNEVMSAVLSLQIMRSSRYLSYDCIGKAKAAFALELSIATIEFTIKAAACTGTNVAILLCEGYAAAKYALAIAAAKELYDYRVNACNNH